MQERLVIWNATPQGIESDPLMGEVDLASHQSVRPVLVDGIISRQQIDGAMFITATNEDHRSAQRSSGIPGEVLGNLTPCRAKITTVCGLGAMSLDVDCRDATQVSDSRAVMTLPNFALPQAIESFDGILQAWLARRRKDRNDLQCHTQAADATHGIGMVMRPLEHIIVVKLGVVREAVRSPAPKQSLYGTGRSALPHDPGIGQRAMQADAGQQADQRTAGDLQVLDEIEAVELGCATCQLGQIPPLWGCRSTLATHGIQRTAPLQHAIDRGTRNDYGLFDGRQRIGDRLPAVLSQDALLAQVRTCSKNLRLPARRRPIPRSSRLAIAEVDPRKGLASRMLNPVADCTDAHRKAPCNRTHGFTAAYCSYHRQPTRHLGAFLP